MDEQESISTELKRIGRDLAATRVLLALSRLERKYLDQPRWPSRTVRQGNQGPGYFAAKNSASPIRTAASVSRALGVAAVAGPEAAAAAGAAVLTGGASVGIGAMGVSSAAHWQDRVGGHGVAPFFGEPLDLTAPITASNGGPSSSSWQSKWQEDCDELAEDDEKQCRKLSGRAAALCWASANERYAECITRGPSGVATRLNKGR